MLGLPSTTELHKPLSKAAIYAKFNLANAVREKYDQDISRIYIENEVSERTVHISPGADVKAFFVLLVQMKRADYYKKILERLSKLIPQNVLMQVVFNELTSLAVFEGGVLMITEPRNVASIELPMIASDLDQLWTNVVSYIGKFKVAEGKNLQETIEQNEEIRKIRNKIDLLKKQAFKETQTRRKWELMSEAKQLEKKLKEIFA